MAAEARRAEPRIKAAVNIDGRHWGEALRHGVPEPYLFIGEVLRMPTAAELAAVNPATRYEALLDQIDYTNLAAHLREQGGIQVTIAGTTHANLSDEGPAIAAVADGAAADRSTLRAPSRS